MQLELKEQFIKFNKKELYQWLIVSMIHPSNQKFGIRYELLIHTLLGIDENKFLNKSLTKKDFKIFIHWFEKKYSNYFMMMEDFTPFNQLNLIPLLFNGKKYYFFYGSTERPYESLKQFYEIIFSVDIHELNEIKNEFLLTLQRQTDILIELIKDEESKVIVKSMYIPTLDFFDKYKVFFESNNLDKDYLHSSQINQSLIEIEKMYDYGIDSIYDSDDTPILDEIDIEIENTSYFYEMSINNFNGLYTKIDSEYFYTPFEVHIEVIYSLVEKIIYSKEFKSLNLIKESMKGRMIKLISQFFTQKQMLLGLMDKSKKIYTKFFDSCSFVDNKVLLFKFIPHDENLNDSLNTISYEALKELEKMKQVEELFSFRHAKGTMIGINQFPIDLSESKIILIFEKLTLNYMIEFDENWKEKNIFIFNSLDIKPILELLNEKKSDKNIALLQYLNAEKQQTIYNNPFQMDALDSFACYYENESFAIMGRQPDMIMIVSHSWSDFYHKYLYNKFQDNIYELVEKDYPNKFNYIIHLGDSTYECIDTSKLDGARCVKYNSKLIWIFYPSDGFSLSDNKMRISLFLGEFLSFYIDRYKDKIFPFLGKYGFNIHKQDLIIVIFFDSLIKKNKDLEHLLSYAKQINSSKNLLFFSQIRKVVYNEIFTGLVVTSELLELENTFKYKDSFNPEKDIFIEFIISILSPLDVQNKEQIAQDFVKEIWDLEERGFVLKQGTTDTPNSELYVSPLKIQPSFISNVNQEMVNYLKELHIETKQYWDDNAKQLNNLIFEFLQKRLEEEIIKYDSSILLYAYNQIEYIEGKREKEKNQMELDVGKYIAFDISEKYNKERIETSELSVCAKHILHSILKVNPNGYKKVADSDWYYLIAFSKIINETIQRSDQLHYKLAKTGIEITTYYELIDIDKSFEIDFNEHYKKSTDLQIISSKNKTLNKVPKYTKETFELSFPFDQKLNQSWKKEYSFYFENMIKLMKVLGHYFNENNNSYFPLLKLSIKEIEQYLGVTLKQKLLLDEITKILDFISLDFEVYKEYKYIDYSIDRLMIKKERLNLSPFIKIDQNYIFGRKQLMTAMYNWYESLIIGDIPFSIDQDSLIKDELKRIHRELDLNLETESYRISKEILGESYVRSTIKNFKQISKEFEKQPPCGEIDLLIVNPATKILFVLDAKNINRKFFTSAIKRELRDFFEGRSNKKSYLEKLNMKVDFINENKEEVLNHFKIVDKNGWKIKKGFVVNTLYVSAFYKEKVDFILIDDLKEYLEYKENS